MLLRQFSAVQTLHASRKLAKSVSLALEDVPQEMVAEVLPSLNLIDFHDQQEISVESFISARQLSGLPVTVVDFEWERAREGEILKREKARYRDRESLCVRAVERARAREILERERERTRTKVILESVQASVPIL